MNLRKAIFLFMLSASLMVCAQHATINSVQALGYMPEFDDMGRPTGVNMVAKVKLTCDHIREGQAGCIILVNNQKLPQINTGIDLLAATQELSFGTEDLTSSVTQKTNELEISLPMDNRLNGKEEVLYAQAFVLYDEYNPKILARSEVVVINPKKLKSLQDEVDTEQATEDMQRQMIGSILGDIVRNPSAIDENGYKICSTCHGEGTVSDDSYNHADERESGRPRTITTMTCEVCGGRGKIKATQADYEMNRAVSGALDAGGVTNDALFDFFMNNSSDDKKRSTSTKKPTNQKSNKKRNGNVDVLKGILDDFLGF